MSVIMTVALIAIGLPVFVIYAAAVFSLGFWFADRFDGFLGSALYLVTCVTGLFSAPLLAIVIAMQVMQ